MSEQIDYAPQLREMKPPRGIVEWLQRHGGLTKEYLIYKAGTYFDALEDRMKSAVKVICSHCGEVFYETKVPGPACGRYSPAPFGWYSSRNNRSVISRDEATCPYCNTVMETVHISHVAGGLYEQAFVAQIVRLPVEGHTDRLAVIDWVVSRTINRDGESRYECNKRTACVVEERKVVSLGGYAQLFYYSYYKELTQRKSFKNDFGRAEHIWPWSPKLLEGTTAENSKLDLYIKYGGKRLVDWLTLWRKKPQAENLLVQGYGTVVVGLLDDEKSAGVPKLPEIDWREKKPARMLGLTTEEFREYRGKICTEEYKAIVWARENGVKIRNGLKDIESITINQYRDTLLEAVGAKDYWRGVEYLTKQKISATYLRDYRNMAQKLKLDMTDGLVLWPRNLKKAHNRVTEAYNQIKDAAVNDKWSARVAELLKFAWERDGLLIRPCASQGELRKEGNTLHHCVFSYADDVLKGKTAIFFIRRADKPEKPWYTLELDEKTLTVRQNRGLRNCGKTPEVQAFEDAWVAWLKETFGDKKKKSAKMPVTVGAA